MEKPTAMNEKPTTSDEKPTTRDSNPFSPHINEPSKGFRRYDSFSRIVKGGDVCAAVTIVDKTLIFSNNTGNKDNVLGIMDALIKIKDKNRKDGIYQINQITQKTLLEDTYSNLKTRRLFDNQRELDLLEQNPQEYFLNLLFMEGKNIQDYLESIPPEGGSLAEKCANERMVAAYLEKLELACLFCPNQPKVPLLNFYLFYQIQKAQVRGLNLKDVLEELSFEKYGKIWESLTSKKSSLKKGKSNPSLDYAVELLELLKDVSKLSKKILENEKKEKDSHLEDKLKPIKKELEKDTKTQKRALSKIIAAFSESQLKEDSLLQKLGEEIKVVFAQSSPKCHAEMDVLQEIYKKKTGFDNLKEPIYIGVSKLCCADCNSVIFQLRQLYPKLFLDPPVRGAHCRPYTKAWNPPPFFFELKLKTLEEMQQDKKYFPGPAKEVQKVAEEAPNSESEADDPGIIVDQKQIIDDALEKEPKVKDLSLKSTFGKDFIPFHVLELHEKLFSAVQKEKILPQEKEAIFLTMMQKMKDGCHQLSDYIDWMLQEKPKTTSAEKFEEIKKDVTKSE